MWMLVLITSISFFALLAYTIFKQQKTRRNQAKAKQISREIIDYFLKTGVKVAAVSINLQGDERFTALIESEPMKRFRLSHIIEYTLRDHIQKTCNLELECIYWRFPVKEANQHIFHVKEDDAPDTVLPNNPAEPERKPLTSTDAYINEGLVPYKDMPKIEVTELDWEKFEEAATMDGDKKIDAPVPSNQERSE